MPFKKDLAVSYPHCGFAPPKSAEWSQLFTELWTWLGAPDEPPDMSKLFTELWTWLGTEEPSWELKFTEPWG